MHCTTKQYKTRQKWNEMQCDWKKTINQGEWYRPIGILKSAHKVDVNALVLMHSLLKSMQNGENCEWVVNVWREKPVLIIHNVFAITWAVLVVRSKRFNRSSFNFCNSRHICAVSNTPDCIQHTAECLQFGTKTSLTIPHVASRFVVCGR